MAARESTVTYRTAWGNVKWDGRGRRQFSTGKNSPDHGPSHTSMWDFLDPVECFEIVYNNIHTAGNILIMVRKKKFPTPGQSIPPLPPLKIQKRKSEKKVHQPPALPPAIEPGFWKTYHNCCEKFCQALYVKLNLSTEGGVPKVTFCSNIVSSVIICSIIGFLLFVLTWVGPATPGSDDGSDDDHNGGNGGEGAVPFSKSMEAFQAWAKKPFPEPSRVVKKGGGGGQGTWGKLLDTDGESHIDRDDPNCDCGEVFSNRIIPTWHHVKAPAGGKAPTAGIAVRHVRRTHSGKLV
uniref:uncharacterized protein LOC101301006 n=1 Tax=Fragaria vesca subsp. vesca TaxID=101020 RepID=UPI0005C8C94F|nr:PREDICTED: uncharacterized protein LOC101301006 [Fragaria vesca subsp. vesca]